MGNIFTTGLFRQMLRSATPVALAAMGGLLTEHAGVMNIGMDGMILIGAFVAVAVSVVTGSAALGVLAAILVGVLVGAFFALFVVKFKSDEFIIGTALNIFAGGLTVFLLGALFGVRGTLRTQAGLPTVDLPLIDQIPFLGEVFSGNSLFIYLTVLIVLIMWTLVYRTPWGRWLRASGEHPGALRTAGGNALAGILAVRGILRLGGGAVGPGQRVHVLRGHEQFPWLCGFRLRDFRGGEPRKGLPGGADVRLLRCLGLPAPGV